ncbi:MAG: hypothetical protein WBC82_03640 [Dehalococcoidia bacterium]
MAIDGKATLSPKVAIITRHDLQQQCPIAVASNAPCVFILP